MNETNNGSPSSTSDQVGQETRLSPGDAAEEIADRIGPLLALARKHKFKLLAYFLTIALMEAADVAAQDEMIFAEPGADDSK